MATSDVFILFFASTAVASLFLHFTMHLLGPGGYYHVVGHEQALGLVLGNLLAQRRSALQQRREEEGGGGRWRRRVNIDIAAQRAVDCGEDVP